MNKVTSALFLRALKTKRFFSVFKIYGSTRSVYDLTSSVHTYSKTFVGVCSRSLNEINSEERF